MRIFVAALALGAFLGVNGQNCGQTPIRPEITGTHIVGGEEAVPNSWPWQISYGKGGSHMCGGSIIGSQWVLTAAHCFDDESLKGWSVRVGYHSLDRLTGTEKTYKVKNVIIHEDYDEEDNDADIALMELEEPISFSDYAQPICLPQSEEQWLGEDMITTGWGATRDGGRGSATLQQVVVQHVPYLICSARGWYGNQINPLTMICAGYEEGGKDSCQGDSGGPLIVKQQKGYVQTGITSWGAGCAKARKPGVYTHLSSFVQWINDKMAGL